jgi:hypothetical protein
MLVHLYKRRDEMTVLIGGYVIVMSALTTKVVKDWRKYFKQKKNAEIAEWAFSQTDNIEEWVRLVREHPEGRNIK